MKIFFFIIIGLLPALVLLAASPAAAEDFDGADTCLKARIAESAPVADCVQQVQAVCLGFDAPSLAGANCYRRAKDHWGDLISRRMETIRARASADVSAIAGIEVKYDLKGNLMQCDRLEDLALVRKDPDEETVYTRQRCEATAVGLAYAKLFYQSHSIR